jgi:ABC-type glycerol-3-phosphate transport system substrate-binding protein
MSNSFSRREFLKIGAGALGAAALAACQAPVQTVEVEKEVVVTATPAPMEVKEITFSWWTGGEGANKIFEESIDRFELANPEYTVNRISMPWGEHHTKVLTMYGSGNAPDAHGVPWGTVWHWAHKEILLDLTPLVDVDADIDWDDMWPAVTGGCEYPKGRKIALPRESFGLKLFFFNKGIFEDAGVDTPEADMAAGDWTWDKWREKALAVTQIGDDGRREIMGTNGNASYWNLQVIMPSLGVPMFNESLTHFNLDDPLVVEHIQMLHDMTNIDESIGKPEETQEFDWASSGKQAIIDNATWAIPNYRETWVDLDWDFVPPPAGDCCHSNFVGCDYHAVNGADYADQEGGWTLIKFLNNPREDLWWALNFFGAPFRRSSVEEWSSQLNDLIPREGWKYMIDMTENATPWTPIPFQDQLNTIHENEINQAISGERPVEEVIESITSQVDEMIAGFE